jgi:uncharacterized protein (TIGR02145 family)
MKNVILLAIFCLLIGVTNSFSQTVTDADGNVYQTVVIGGQEWMVENLRVSRYNNGDDILTNQDLEQWQAASEGIWVNFNNDPANDAMYGKLYNWYATVDERGLCPTGWRVPTDNDWQQLTFFVDANAWGNNNSAGSQLKSRRQVNSPLGGEYNTTEHPRWDSHDIRFGTDDFGFNALPAGGYNPSDGFASLGVWAYFLSVTEGHNNHVWVRTVLNSHKGMSRSLYPKTEGFSVRCIKGSVSESQVPQLITLNPQNVTTSSAVLGGVVNFDGGSEVTARGVLWGATENPTLDDNLGTMPNGNGLGEYSEMITGLSAGDMYWIRAYATNSAGTAYGIQKRLAIPISAGFPVLTTSSIENITHSSAQSGGNITSNGGALISSRGIVWSVNQNPTIDNNDGQTSDGDGEGAYESILSGLLPESEYFVRAYAVNSQGVSYGDEKSFITSSLGVLYALTLTVNSDGWGSATGAGDYEAGAEVDLVATPEAGYQFVNWTFGADVLGTSASYTYTMPEGNVALVANFEEIPATLYELSISVSPEGTGSATGTGEYEAGSEVDLVATPEAGYQFVNWTLGADVLSTSASYTYTMPEGDVALVANFEEQSSAEDGDPCPDAPTVTDFDGNIYNTVYIGGQCWLKENLQVTHYANGDEIVKDTDWASATTGVYGVYSFASIADLNSEQEVLNAYGALYNWYAVADERGLCPTGWRVATISDWDGLANYVSSIDANQVGNQLKSCRQVGHPNGGACDTSEHPRWNFNVSNSGDDRYNFSSLPAGFRDQSGNFQQVGSIQLLWTGTSYDEGNARYIEIKVSGPDMVSTYRNAKNYGSSVRCIKE